MKYLWFLMLSLFLSCNSSQKAIEENSTIETNTASVYTPLDPTYFAETITEEELKEYLYVYASDEFEGRETGEPGQKKAIAFIKEAYEQIDIPAAQENGDYFQKVPLEIARVPKGSINTEKGTYKQGEDFVTFSHLTKDFDNIVYMGYGIEDEGYSDYKDHDVKGKIVLIKSGEPKNDAVNYTISGTITPSVWSDAADGISAKFDLAINKGALGVLYYDPAYYPRYKNYYDYNLNAENGKMELSSKEDSPIFVLVTTEMAMALNPTIENEAKSKIIEGKVSLNIENTNKIVDSENVIAILKGSEKPEEYIVISSHLDHIGITGNQINNGADDDGSGTVAMLEIAEAFKEASLKGQGPKRSIVFLHVTGEEKGLFGSQYYTDFDPIFPLEQTVTNLNIDMIGRIDPKRQGNRNYVYLIGSDKLSSELHQLSEEVNNKYTQLELDYTYNDENDPNRFYYRSDHYNFAKNDIPIIFYFNGTHDDYHKPGDTPDKINYDLLENRSRLIFYTAWELANRQTKPKVDVVPSK
ncbi:M28 family peptidase [Eudoraea sp.]|uniref:M28 family peptidase n=1 Tax=Eudoraea sp. TaxID=1979955 RepID=UPI003C771E55